MAIDFAAGTARYAGKRERYLCALREAIRDLPLVIAQIQVEIEHGNSQEAQHLIHALRGRVGVLGMESLHENLLAVEVALRSETTPSVVELLEEVIAESARTFAEVDHLDSVPELLAWDKSYETGVREIDAQHQGLFAIVNEIVGWKRATPDYRHELLSRLTDYAATHFATEEDYFRQTELTGIDEHLTSHTQFIEEVSQASLDAMHGRVNFDRISEYLRHWLLDHVLESDRTILMQK